MLEIVRKVYPNAVGSVIASAFDEASAQLIIDGLIAQDAAALRQTYGAAVSGPERADYPCAGTSVHSVDAWVRLNDRLVAAVEIWVNKKA